MKKLFVLLVIVVFTACSPSQVAFNQDYSQCGDSNCKYGSTVHSHLSLDQVLW